MKLDAFGDAVNLCLESFMTQKFQTLEGTKPIQANKEGLPTLGVFHP